ncbi:MAG: hypothetical protein QM696_12225 [Steroidobacteraceae bacterium]
MNLPRPSVDEERWLVLAARYPQLRAAARTRSGPWRCATPLTRLLSFVLGVALAGFARTVLDLIGLPQHDFFCGIALLAAAEWLIAKHHLHASGIEEALWSCGAALIVASLPAPYGSLGSTANTLLFAAAAALAGWRLINPWLTTLAALLASIALVSVSAFSMRRTELASLACFAAAFIALGAGSLQLQRPGSDRMLDGLVVALPIAAYFWSLWSSDRPPTQALLRTGQWQVLWAAALLLAFGGAALITGLRRRRHPPLTAALACLLLLAFELRALTGLALHWRLMLWGTVGLAGAIVAERLLRVPRRGITSRGGEPGDDRPDLLQIGGAALVTPATAAPAAAPLQGQGGQFGGGGASGRF